MKLLPLLIAPVACLGIAAAFAPSASDWTVNGSTPMSTPRAAHQATLLSAREVLFTGGCSGPGCSPVEASAEVLDLGTGRVLATPPMQERRVSHVSALLPDGRVLVAGGWTGSATSPSAEVYVPASRGFKAVGAMATARMDATATVLQDGSVLVIGGASATNLPVAQAERFDPTLDRFVPASTLAEARAHHAAVRLPDGRVLVMGGLTSRNTATRTAEIHDPANQRFQPTGPMLQPRCKHAALLLKDGRVMVIGGSADCNGGRRLAQTEIYDPATATFSAGPSLLNPRYKVASAAAVLPGGEVVMAGDADDVEIWTPGQPHFARARGSIGLGLAFSVATVLPDGDVLVSGGYDNNIQATARTWRVQHLPGKPVAR